MSIWGGEPNANDDAADWLIELEDAPSMATLREAFDAVDAEDDDTYLEVTEAACAVMAAAVLADLLEPRRAPVVDAQVLDALKADFSRLTAARRKKLVAAATRSLRAAADAARSELAELMDEDAQMAAAWQAHLDAIAEVLRAQP